MITIKEQPAATTKTFETFVAENTYAVAPQPGDILTIPGKEIFCETIQGNKILFVVAIGKSRYNKEVERKFVLQRLRDAKGEWMEMCDIFGIFDRPFKVESITDYGYRKIFTLINP